MTQKREKAILLLIVLVIFVDGVYYDDDGCAFVLVLMMPCTAPLLNISTRIETREPFCFELDKHNISTRIGTRGQLPLSSLLVVR